ncbi:MAG: copper resistance protein CopC [Thermomicrobiales bacterium]|nr:copper resistance protein CopC [Thermomicrobiales bacterium]
MSFCPRISWRWLASAAIVLFVLLGVSLPESAGAHATLDRSEPPPNAVVPQSPAEIRLWFTEPLEQGESSIRIFDQMGDQIPNIESEPGEGPKELVAALPEPLATGTYSVVWKNISSADGHPQQGYFTFTIGSALDVAPIMVPVLDDTGGAPLWLQSIARWLVLLALAVVVAVWPVWLLVGWPAVRHDPERTRELAMRVRTVGLGAIVMAVFANLLMLGVQASFLESGSLVARMGETVTSTRFGRLWLARIGLLLLMAMVLRFVSWLDPLGKRIVTAAALITAALLPIPVSMNAHASALDTGRTTAIVFDYVHLLTASLWFGGLVVLAGIFLRSLRGKPAQRATLARAMPRFSGLALVCWGLLAVTGLYAWWLQVGSWDALRHTPYGQSLLFKLIVAGIVLLIAAANLLLITRKLGATQPDANPRWAGRLGYAVIAEIVLALLILLAVGRMTSQQPGRDVIAAERTGQTTHFVLDGRDVTLRLIPGAAGPNHFVVTIPGEPVPTGTEVLLRLTFGETNIGIKEMSLGRTTLTTFESHGSEFGIAGEWEVELLMRKIGAFDWTDTQQVSIGTTGSTAPKAPWRFETGGVIGLVLVTFGFIGLVFGWRAGKGRLRVESAGLGIAAVLLGAMLMVQGRVQPGVGYDPNLVNPVPATADVIARGDALFAANCLSCHGVDGRGAGPLAEGMLPKPADFSAPHTKVHPDGQLFAWIQNGKPGTDMPAFGSTFTDEQIWEVIDYIQVAFQDEPLVEASPTAGS